MISIRTTLKYLSAPLFVFALSSCSDDSLVENRREKYFINDSEKYSGISIENGPRQGFQYLDSLGAEYNYRYITTTITNDSVIPIHIKISFSEEYNYLRSSGLLKLKVFLLPRELAPSRQHFDQSMSKELKDFLDKDVDKPVTLDKIIEPNEKLVMTFAVFNKEEYGEYMRMELIPSKERFHLNAKDSLMNLKHSSADSTSIYLGLNLVNAFVIPCGQISFRK